MNLLVKIFGNFGTKCIRELETEVAESAMIFEQ